MVATDPVTGETGPREVVDLIRHSGWHTMVAVGLADGTTIDATDLHPFWVDSRAEWVDAIDLNPEDVLFGANGDRLTVTSVGISVQDLTAYNLTITGLHTYYAGNEPVLVYNAGCDPSDLRGLSDSYVKRLLRQYDTEPHAFKEEFVGRADVSKFDVQMGPRGESHVVNKDGSIVIPTGVIPEP